MSASRGGFVAALAIAGLEIAFAPAVRAQDVQVAVDPGPHYVGDAISIRLTVRGLEEQPTPQASAPDPTNGSLEFAGVSPSVSQSITIINGRMGRTREVSHVFQFRFVASRPGRVEVGPFQVTQGSTRVGSPSVRLAVQDIPSSDSVAVEVKLPKGPFYVGERIPVRVEFALEKSLQQNVLSYDLRAPLFDRQQQFRVLEAGEPGDTKVVLQTAAGALELSGTTRSIGRGGRTFVVVSLERTIVPLSAGSHELPAATLSVQEGVRWRRDFFGGRRATQLRRWRAQDRARTLDVKSIPGGGRPASFAGAIGSGFTLDVAADRTVVQVGDPISLTFTLRGDGLETARLPPLDAPGLLPGRAFRVPAGDLTGEIVGDAKRFRAVVRVLEERVDEIPALAYSWFEPSSQKYQTTHSRPIALAVRSAEVIGAADVQGDPAPGSSALPDRDPTAPTAEGEVGVRARSFALTGADLAIERNPEKLLATGRPAWAAAWVVASLYGSALVVESHAGTGSDATLIPDAMTPPDRSADSTDNIDPAVREALQRYTEEQQQNSRREVWHDAEMWPTARADESQARRIVALLLLILCLAMAASHWVWGTATWAPSKWKFEWLFSFPAPNHTLLSRSSASMPSTTHSASSHASPSCWLSA